MTKKVLPMWFNQRNFSEQSQNARLTKVQSQFRNLIHSESRQICIQQIKRTCKTSARTLVQYLILKDCSQTPSTSTQRRTEGIQNQVSTVEKKNNFNMDCKPCCATVNKSAAAFTWSAKRNDKTCFSIVVSWQIFYLCKSSHIKTQRLIELYSKKMAFCLSF